MERYPLREAVARRAIPSAAHRVTKSNTRTGLGFTGPESGSGKTLI
jgi:hypothetical protein